MPDLMLDEYKDLSKEEFGQTLREERTKLLNLDSRKPGSQEAINFLPASSLLDNVLRIVSQMYVHLFIGHLQYKRRHLRRS